MSKRASAQRAAILLLFCGGCVVQHAPGRSHAKPASSTAGAFTRAEQQREALEGRQPQQRTRAQYERVLDAYRAIYHQHPASAEADAAVDAVASLLAEEGRGFHDAPLLHDSIGQYQYLRQKYAASHFRQSALLSEAEISQSDLQDLPAAHEAFAEFLRNYPHSPLASEARQQLKALAQQEKASASATTVAGNTASATTVANNTVSATTVANNTKTSGSGIANRPDRAARPVQPVSKVPDGSKDDEMTGSGTSPGVALDPAQQPATPGGHALITGIRHWSTPVYTRVAIDLSSEVQYEAARVPDPDRIYFDLHGARLAPELIGKAVDVTDGGFLRHVRVARYSSSSTRVVLDVSHVSEYSAFFLPNPWRLIIDIHGSAPDRVNDAASGKLSPSPSPSPFTTPSTSPGIPAAQTSASLNEVTLLAKQPTRVKATHHPTTGPIAASVSGSRRAAAPNELDALASDPAAASASSAAPASAASASAASPANAPGAIPSGPRKSRHSGAPAMSSGQTISTTVATNLTPETPMLGAREATPTASGERSLVRALGLKIGRIVIDAGHGGHDSGTLGPSGIEEKDVVLDVALRLGKLLKQRLGADVIYTRDDDTFIPLETRTAIANKSQADLFISVHANSSSDHSARGVEVYYLNFTTSPEALEVAARENAVSDQSIYQLSDLVKKITLKDKIDESHEFAADVESSLYSGLEAGNEGLKDRGVKKAPFVVLIGANMPSILAEISFLTNAEDARQLRDPLYRERIAESLYQGTARYVSGLSGVRLAQSGKRETPLK